MRGGVADRGGFGVKRRKNIYAKGQRIKGRDNPVIL